MGLFPYPSPDRSWSWIKDDFRTVPRVYLGLPEGTIGDFSGTLGWSVYDNAVSRASSEGGEHEYCTQAAHMLLAFRETVG